MIGSRMLRSTTWPAAGAVAVPQRHQHRRGGSDTADAVGQAERGQRRRTVGLAGGGGEAAHRLGERAEPGARGVGAGLSEAGEPDDDQARVLGHAARRGRSPSAPGCRGGSSPPPRRRCAARRRKTSAPSAGLEVEGDGPLVAADLLPPQRHAVLAPAVATHVVAAARVLDLDHIGAEVAEDLAAQGAGEDGRDVEDPQALQWRGVLGHKTVRSAQRNVLMFTHSSRRTGANRRAGPKLPRHLPHSVATEELER